MRPTDREARELIGPRRWVKKEVVCHNLGPSLLVVLQSAAASNINEALPHLDWRSLHAAAEASWSTSRDRGPCPAVHRHGSRYLQAFKKLWTLNTSRTEHVRHY